MNHCFLKWAFLAKSAFILITFGARIADAQQSVRGSVTEPLGAVGGGAKVTLQGGGANPETTTDSHGVYTFPTVPEGRYHLQVEAAGFATYLGSEVFVGAPGSTTLDAILQLSSVSQGLSVSATGSEVPIAQVGSSV